MSLFINWLKKRAFEKQLTLDLALQYYQQGLISLGRAAELSRFRRS